jgi:hypothetical protein
MRWLKKTSQQNWKKEKIDDTNENNFQREGDKDDHLTQTHRANRWRPLPARRHLRRFCRRLCGTQDVRRRGRGYHGEEPPRELRTGASGVVADLFNATVWIFLGMTLYLLLKHVNKNAASAMVVLVAIGASIVCLNTVFEFEGLRAATGAINLTAFGIAGSNALVLLLLDTQHYGIFIAQIFFGLWLVPLGYLAYKSAGWFPRWLGVLLVMGGACYLVDLLAQFLVPDFGQIVHVFFSVVAAIAEISMVLYLLVIGVKTVKPDERILAVG